MRILSLFLIFALFNPVVLLSQSAEDVLGNGIVRGSMPFENEQYIGFQLLIEYDEELHVCTFKVVSDTQQLQNCTPMND
jgi:hypothetical protein